jgi:hypothetical protein
LFARIRPVVGIVEIEVDLQTGGFCTLGESDVVVEVLFAIAGIDPYALADGVHAAGFENGLEGLGLAGGILVRFSGFFFNE